MKREGETLVGPITVPGVVSLSASSRRTLKHGDTFAMFDEFGDVIDVPHSPAGLFHFDTRFLSHALFTLEGQLARRVQFRQALSNPAKSALKRRAASLFERHGDERRATA